jgi:periplasmic protein TonB
VGVARCLVTVEGALAQCRMVKSVPLMDESILDSMATRLYEPARVGARKVASEITIPVRVGPSP